MQGRLRLHEVPGRLSRCNTPHGSEIVRLGVHTFWDLGHLVDYDSDVRTRSIQVLLDERRRIASMHAYGEAQNVRLGVLTARIVLGAQLAVVHVHETRASFEGALAQLLASRGR